MDIERISGLIARQIMEDDRVVLPGFGVFSTELVPSVFQDNGYMITPPGRRLYFRSREETDSAIAEIVGAEDGLSVEDAMRKVAEFCAEMRMRLERRKVLVLPGLGRLRATKENNFFFIPDEDLDIYPEGYGLRPVSLKNHVVEALAEDEIPETAAEEETPAEAAPETEVPVEAAPAAEEGPVPAAPAAETEEKEKDMEETIVEERKGPERRENGPETGQAESAARKNTRRRRREGRTAAGRMAVAAGIAVGAVAALLAVFVLTARLFPGIFDFMLYSSAELDILNYPL